jgi:Carboxypeptidase regulatory-like domain
MITGKPFLYAGTAFVAGFLFASVSSAQNITGTILGSVTDITGAAVTGASIVVVNDATNAEYKAVSGASEFTVTNLPPGHYSVRAELTGFRPSITKDITLLANRTERVNIVLSPGSVNQTVEVTASAPVVNSENATVGNILQSDAITTVPLNGRTVDRLIRISAGVSTDNANNPRVAGSPYWGGISFNVDGVGYNDSGNGGGAYSYKHGLSTQPSVDAISEFKIDSNSMKAEFESGVSVTVVTKGGSNEVHGSALWFNRNREYAAKNFFQTGQPKPAFNRNEVGATVGGPLVKNRLFFFGSFEDLLERSSLTTSGLSVPTDAMKNGNFAGLATIIDPTTGVAFPNNQIPANRIDPRAQALAGRYPQPNLPGASNGSLQNYIASIPNKYDVYRFGLRLDYKASDNDSFYVNLNYSKGDPYFVAQNYPQGYGSWENGGYTTKSLNATYTHTFSPTVVNEARFGFLSHASARQGMNKDFDPRSLFPGLYPVDYGGLPYINITSYSPIGDYGGAQVPPETTPQYIDNLTWVRGKHTIKTGLDFAIYRVSSTPSVAGLGSGLVNNAGLGRFDFTGRYTTSTPTAAPANAFADFLLGDPNTTYRSSASPAEVFSSTRYSAYVQDDIQVSSRLSLSLGLRYMVQIPWSERDGRMAQFDSASGKLYLAGSQLPPGAQPALVNAYPITFASALGLSNTLIQTDSNNWQPRVGIAYRPFGNGKTVIRSGFGVYTSFLPVFIGFRQLGFSNPPFLLAETFESAAGRTPTLTLANPFPGNGTISPNPSITAVQRNLKNADSYQWNFTVEHELARNLGVRASYVGNRSAHLPWYNYPINLSQQQIPGTLQPNRPYQPWADILALASGGDSTMHQLQLEGTKRYSSGLTFQLEYSWTSSLDDTPTVGGPQDPYNVSADRGFTDGVRKHVFTLAYSYELPFGRGKSLLSNAGPAMNALVGGWEIAGITYLRTGTPFSLSITTTQTGWRATRPNAVRSGELSRSERTINRWFDPSGYSLPAPFTYGNSARNSLFGPGDMVFDVSFLKNFSILERVKAQLRGEFFNFPNHANFNNPATNISVPSTVGRITSAGDPRQVQFGLKFLF